jgi:hypothetical protein
MTPQRQSATILQFPLGGLQGVPSWKARKDEPAPAPAAPVIIDSWYHEAAMQDAKPQ